jgi:hypothetical protein
MHGIFAMSLAELERAAARAFDCGAKATLLRIAERKAELRQHEERTHAQAA